MEWSPRFLVPFLFRQSHREDRIDGPAAELNDRYPAEASTRQYIDQLTALAEVSKLCPSCCLGPTDR